MAWLRVGYALVIAIVMHIQPADVGSQTYRILAVYGFVAYSLAVLLYEFRTIDSSDLFALVTCRFDLVFAIVLTASASTAMNTFLAYSLFPVMTAAVYTGFNAALTSALIQVVVFGVLTTVTRSASWLASTNWLVQSSYLLFFTALIGTIRRSDKPRPSLPKQVDSMTQDAGAQNERQRIARELHDRVLQSLATVTMRAESCRTELLYRPVEMEHELEAIEAATHQAISEIRGLLAEAQTSGQLSKGSLERRLKEELEIFRSRTPLKLEFQCQIDQKNLPYEVERELYFTLREGVLNAMRHSRATELSLSLTQQGRNCCARLVDNGIGFDVSSAEGGNHYGLRGMRERIKKLGGELLCESGPGAGTRISITVPI